MFSYRFKKHESIFAQLLAIYFIVVKLVIGRLTEDVDPPAAPFRRPNTALPSDKEDDDVSTPTPE